MPEIAKSLERAEIGVGDIVRCADETFNSCVMQVCGENLQMAGWPNPWFDYREVTLVEKYDPATAHAGQRECVERDRLRREAEERAIAMRCPHCKGTGRRPENG